MKPRILYYDILNICACIAVISLHHNHIAWTYSNSWTWKGALIVEVIAYWGVPIFLMLTGATLMNYQEKYDTRTFFRKRFLRTVIPFFVWSIIVLLWKIASGQYIIKTGSFQEIINIILNYKLESAYWFFPFLFSVYLTMPILSCLTEPKHRAKLRYAIIVMFILQCTIVPFAKLAGIAWNNNFAIGFNDKFIFVLLGYYLSITEISCRKRYLIYACGLAAAVFRYGAIFLLSIQIGKRHPVFFNYGYFTSVLLACAVFVFFKQVPWGQIFDKLNITAEQVAKISSYSLGIYLIHKIVMFYELKLGGGIRNYAKIRNLAYFMHFSDLFYCVGNSYGDEENTWIETYCSVII